MACWIGIESTGGRPVGGLPAKVGPLPKLFQLTSGGKLTRASFAGRYDQHAITSLLWRMPIRFLCAGGMSSGAWPV